MKRHLTPNNLLIVCACLVLLVNLVVISFVWANRNIGETNRLILTERELNIPRRTSFNKEDSSVKINIKWRAASSEYSPWHGGELVVTPEKLKALGFTDYESVNRQFYNQPEKELYWLLEYDGKTYKDALSHAEAKYKQTLLDSNSQEKADDYKLEDATKRWQRELNENSRLFVVDVAANPEDLKKHTNSGQHLIVKGLVRAGFRYDQKSDKKNKPKVYHLRLRSLSVPSIHLPVSLISSPSIRQAKKEWKDKIKYKATVNWGSRYEPWISELALEQ